MNNETKKEIVFRIIATIIVVLTTLAVWSILFFTMHAHAEGEEGLQVSPSGPVTIPIKEAKGWRLWYALVMVGEEPMHCMVDSGGAVLYMKPEAIERLRLEQRRGKYWAPSIQVGNYKALDVPVWPSKNFTEDYECLLGFGLWPDAKYFTIDRNKMEFQIR